MYETDLKSLPVVSAPKQNPQSFLLLSDGDSVEIYMSRETQDKDSISQSR